MIRPPSAGGQPSRVRFAGLGYALAVLLTGTNLATPLYAGYERAFRLSPLDVTLLVAVYAAAVVVALLICGPLSDAAGYRPVLVAGLAAAACGAALLAYALGPGWLFAGRAVQGAAVGTCSGALTAGLVLTEPRGRRARASFLAATVTTAACGFGPVLAGALAQYAPAPRTLSYLVEIGLLVPAVVAAAALPRSLGVTGQRWRPRWPGVPARIRAAFLVPAVVSLLAWAVAYVVLALVPSYAAAALGGSNLLVDGAAAGSLLLVAALAQAACRSWSPARAQQAGLAGLAGGLVILIAAGLAGRVTVLFAAMAVAGRRAGARVHGRHPAGQRDRAAGGPRRDRGHVLRGDLRGQRPGHCGRGPARHPARPDRGSAVVRRGARSRVPAHARGAAAPPSRVTRFLLLSASGCYQPPRPALPPPRPAYPLPPGPTAGQRHPPPGRQSPRWTGSRARRRGRGPWPGPRGPGR
jgi:MFS family permease